MENKLTARRVIATVALVALTLGAWAGWLGWDQERDVHPDGSTTGPYEAWQVIGLVLTLLVAVVLTAWRIHPAVPVVGVTAGLAGAAFHDWSDDATGLFMVGVVMVFVGSLAATSAVAAVVSALTSSRQRTPVPGLVWPPENRWPQQGS
ncbi:hypothetical protein ACIBI4_18630 [Streptomyces sp. NPDC050418]|uniref:hypothetical protein n=1 Tax=Streptomyces sp. NPDC050418 TaxID=3365612 RepID=UPI0037ABAAD9